MCNIFQCVIYFRPARRPRPAQVDSTLKRVQEGCDEWDVLWDKLESTEVGGGVP